MRYADRLGLRVFSRVASEAVFFALVALMLVAGLPGCKQTNAADGDAPNEALAAAPAPSADETGDKTPNLPDAPEDAANSQNAGAQNEAPALPKIERAQELEILRKLEQAGLLRAGLSFIAETPAALESSPENGIPRQMTCYAYRIGENNDDRFVTLEFVYFCPAENKLYRYDAVADKYEEIIGK